ncbi:MAG: GNAT family N-acetyltransferase [Pseudomonadota bacterium]
MRIRQYKNDDAAAVIELLGGHRFKRRIMDWQFASSKHQCLVLEDDAQDPIGFNGVIPVAISLSDAGNVRCSGAIWSCDFAVAAHAQGKGFGKLLKQSLHAQHDVIMALGISDAAASVHKKLGWRPIAGRVFQIMRRNRSRRRRDSALRALQWLNRMVGSLRPGVLPGYSVSHGAVSEATLATLAEIWACSRHTWPAAIDRSYDYLRWRYHAHPTANYSATILRDVSGNGVAALIWRFAEDHAHIVDYVGPSGASAEKRRLVRSVFKVLEGASTIACTTSDPDLRSALFGAGAYTPRSSQIRFSIWQKNEAGPHLAERQWLIMGGDSDGELLEAATVTTGRRITRVALSGDTRLERQWPALRAACKSDALFSDYQWLTTWWRVFSQVHDLEDQSVAMFDEADQLVGVLPLYRTRQRLRFPITVERLQCMGGSWQGPSMMRSEYLRPIIRDGEEARFLGACCDLMAQWRWDDCVIADTPAKGSMFGLMLEKMSGLGLVRQPRYYRDTSYQVDCRGSFEDYVQALSQSARRRLIGSEKRLVRLHGPYSLQYSGADDIEDYLEELNALHRVRWGKPVFEGARYTFIRDISRQFAERNALHLTRITLEGRTISVLLSLEADGALYNLQAGFDEHFDRRIPLGYVHLGLQIRACFDSHLHTFDLLAGKGKNTDFKRQFAAAGTDLTVLHIVRARWLRWLYRLRDAAAH